MTRFYAKWLERLCMAWRCWRVDRRLKKEVSRRADLRAKRLPEDERR